MMMAASNVRPVVTPKASGLERGLRNVDSITLKAQVMTHLGKQRVEAIDVVS